GGAESSHHLALGRPAFSLGRDPAPSARKNRRALRPPGPCCTRLGLCYLPPAAGVPGWVSGLAEPCLASVPAGGCWVVLLRLRTSGSGLKPYVARVTVGKP